MIIYPNVIFNESTYEFIADSDGAIEINVDASVITDDNFELIQNYSVIECYFISNNSIITRNSYAVDLRTFKDTDNLYYNYHSGLFIYLLGDETRFSILNRLSQHGTFNYYLIAQNYSCFNYLKSFKTMLSDKIENKNPSKLSFNYTFGLEYETSSGVVPERECFKHGLIPLRDGSVTGNEYASVVMDNNTGYELIKKQLEVLQNYTKVDTDCSLHVHIGGFKLHQCLVYTVYRVMCKLQKQLEKILPAYTFHTSEFKTSEKNYCELLPEYKTFQEYYNFMECTDDYCYDKRLPSPFKVHIQDTSGNRKWNIPTRYFCVNFINAINYNRNKTIEFRFLKPTRNYNLIVDWIIVFQYIICHAEQIFVTICQKRRLNQNFALGSSVQIYEDELNKMIDDGITIENITNSPSYFNDFINNVQLSTELSNSADDKIGKLIHIDNLLFTTNFLSHLDK